MITTIFGVLCIISCFFAAITGNLDNMSLAVIQGCEEAVSIILILIGVLGLWNGLMKVLENSGILYRITGILYPLLRFIYPDAAKKKNGLNEIAMAMIANFFGLGNAATAFSLSAMKRLSENNGSAEEPSYDMISFTVLSTCALNFMPTTLLALRHANNSTDPFEIVLPVWIVSGGCFVFAVLLLKMVALFKKG